MVSAPGSTARVFQRLRGARALALVACATSLLAACASEPTTRPRTELVLLVDTDIAELTRVDFELTGAGHATEQRSAQVRDDGAPLTLGVVREQGPLGPLTAVARGFAGSHEVVSREAVLYFAEGRTLVVPMHLLRSCVGVSCDEGLTCSESSCTSSLVELDELAEWPTTPPDVQLSAPDASGGMDASAPREDAGVTADAGDARDAGDLPDAAAQRDAGLDAAQDGADAGLDAGSDAGLPDTGSDAELDAGSDAGIPDAGSDAGLDAGIPDAGTTCSGTPVNLSNDVNHCGSCTNVCSPSYIYLYHDAPACVSGQCTYVCATLWGDCNGSFTPFLDRCETYLGNDTKNCGACGRRCNTGEVCTSGVCVL